GSTQPKEGAGQAAHRSAQSQKFRQGTRDQRRLRIIAQGEPVTNPGRDGKNVLQGAAELDSYDFIAAINPKASASQERLEMLGDLCVFASQNGRRWKPARDFGGEVGSGKDRVNLIRENLPKDLAHAQPGLMLDPFGATEHNPTPGLLHFAK